MVNFLVHKIWLYIELMCKFNFVNRHTYTATEKAAYINAELCLQSLPATLGLPGTVTRFDELQATHAMQAELVHGVVCIFDH